MNLEDEIFSIDSNEEFTKTALKVYEFQLDNCAVYREFVENLNRNHPKSISEIPFLPISFFKTHLVTQSNFTDFEATFLSSGTTSSGRSKHLIPSLGIYQRAFTQIYTSKIGDPTEQVILALLPNYIEQGSSSLVFMVQNLIEQSKNPSSGFMLNEPDNIKNAYDRAILKGKKVVIFGVTYALLDLAKKNVDLSQAIIIETGGMKGRRKEISKEELHQELKRGLGAFRISSEYGMTELLSQAYSNKDGLFSLPPWMKILCRDTNDPFSYVESGKTGGINVIDLANLYSCSFIATQDLGKMEGEYFHLMGRFDNSDIRGCNLMVE